MNFPTTHKNTRSAQRISPRGKRPGERASAHASRRWRLIPGGSLAALLTLLFLLPAAGHASNIDLATVPERGQVQLTIYNAEDLTLVRERRVLTFKEGDNPLQFSWANTLIDPTSVDIEFLDRPDELTVLDTTYPHDRRQVLYWNVRSDFAGEAAVEISYFTSGISWAADYTAIAREDEDEARLEGYVTVTNNSGEDYEDAQIRLVVGTINLVEQIRRLAEQGMANNVQPDRQNQVALREALRRAEPSDRGGQGLFAAAEADGAKQVVKDGLSEYFIFTIEGTETVPDGWAKRLRSFDAADVPVTLEYRFRPREYGEQLVRMYLMRNSEEAGLGDSPLPDGTVRVFRQKNDTSLSYLTQQHIQYVPIGDDIELNLGPDPEVVFELEKLHVFRDNLWGRVRGNIERRLDEPGVRVDDQTTVIGWDTHTVYAQYIRNYRSDAINVEVRRTFEGDVTFRSGFAAEQHDYQTVEYTASVEPGESARLVYEIIQREGRNQEQSRVEIEEGEAAAVPWM